MRAMFKRILALVLILGLMPVAALSESTEYRIEVDIANQIVTVFRAATGDIVRQMICSSGRNNATPLGHFTLSTRKSTDRKPWYHISSKWYVRYATRIQGPFLFHSLPYLKMDESTIDLEQLAKIGSPASAGCVRLYAGDAKWISDHCADGTPVYIYSDGEINEPLKNLLTIEGYAEESGLNYRQFVEYALRENTDGSLGRGASGEDVRTLQTRLKGLGFLSGAVTGVYDSATCAAVSRYQAALGLEQNGLADPALLERLNGDTETTGRYATLDRGDRGPAIEALQRTLKAIGFYDGAVDGAYSDALSEAVAMFAAYAGMPDTRSASPEIQAAAEKCLEDLNARYGEGRFAALLQHETVRTVNTRVKARLYLEATTKSKRLAYVAKGRTVALIDEDDAFSHVLVDGKKGYMRNKDLVNTYDTTFTIAWGIPAQNVCEQTLNRDSIGPAVAALRERLAALGFLDGASGAVYDEAVEAAVAGYQIAAGREASGEADVDVQRMIMETDGITGTAVTLEYGCSGPAVAGMQRTLGALQYYDGPCDGRFDDRTVKAVRLFTLSNGFGESAVATPAAQAAMRSQLEHCEATYGSGGYTLSIAEVRSQTGTVKSSSAKLYTAPSTRSERLTRPAKGSSVDVISREGKWCLVRCGDLEGYIQQSKLKVTTRVDYVAEFNAPDMPAAGEVLYGDEEVLEEAALDDPEGDGLFIEPEPVPAEKEDREEAA